MPGAKKTVAKKGMHKMPDGTMMKNSDMKKPTPKSTKKPKPLTGPAAVEAIQRRTSPAGVKKAEKDAKKLMATKKKYPGLYK
jgi:hypothetical protein